VLKYNLSLAQENVFGWQRRTSSAGREESCFWLPVEKLFCLAEERLWLVEENVFGWQRRTFLSGRGGSLWLAVEKVFAVKGERLWLAEKKVFSWQGKSLWLKERKDGQVLFRILCNQFSLHSLRCLCNNCFDKDKHFEKIAFQESCFSSEYK